MPSPSRHSFLRWAGVLAPPLVLGLGFAWVGGVFSPHRLSSERFMTVLHNAGSPGEGFRRAHAKGVCVTGWFDPSDQLTPYSTAAVFSQKHTPVIGRLALAPPFPHVPDGPTLTRSMALRFLPDHADEWRTAMNDPPLLPMRNATDAFATFSAAQLDPVTHRPDPQKAKEYEAARPWLETAFEAVRHQVHSSDFANDRFNSLNSFRLIDAQGQSHTVRWSMVPLNAPASAPNSPPSDNTTNMTEADTSSHDPNILFKRLIDTLHQRPLTWSLVVTLAGPHDATSDPSQPWSAEDQKLTAGTLTLTNIASEDDGPCNGTVFDPTTLPTGMALSDDPIPALRSAVYMHSFAARSGEHKDPSSVTPAMTAPSPAPSSR